MPAIFEVMPDADVVLAFEPEELAYYVLEVARQAQQNGLMHLQDIVTRPAPGHLPSPYGARENEVQLAIREAWNWLRVQGLLIPADGMNGNTGFCLPSRRGRRIAAPEDMARFRDAAGFPKGLMHPSIADRVWLELVRGHLADAVFISFRTVEEALRAAGRYAATDIGIDLARRAFNPDTGPLRDENQARPEREALMHLFAGAIGSYKNPHSHRTVTIEDPKEAQEMVMLASHLLRIIDARRHG